MPEPLVTVPPELPVEPELLPEPPRELPALAPDPLPELDPLPDPSALLEALPELLAEPPLALLPEALPDPLAPPLPKPDPLPDALPEPLPEALPKLLAEPMLAGAPLSLPELLPEPPLVLPDPLPELLRGLLPDSLSEEWPLEGERMSEGWDEQALGASVVSVASARVCFVLFMLKPSPARRVPSVLSSVEDCPERVVPIADDDLRSLPLTRYADRRAMHARRTQGMRRRRILRHHRVPAFADRVQRFWSSLYHRRSTLRSAALGYS
jgi:hypothetical protein